MVALPSFLSFLSTRPSRGPYINAVYSHNPPLGPVHCLWWPPRKPGYRIETVVLFIPGNPGLLDFYTPFLTALQDKDSTENLAILAHGHIDHTPGISTHMRPHSRHSLVAQVHSAIEAFDAITGEFAQAKVVLVGHSVGAWIALQVLKERPNFVSGVFLLFPTICYIGDTPNGKKLSRLLKPIPRRVTATLSVVGRHIPRCILRRLVGREWPIAQLKVLEELINSPECINATMQMGDEEMMQIRELDVDLLRQNHELLWFYFAESDDWVGDQKAYILNHFKPDAGALRITHGLPQIRHAFCINHGEEIAQQCHQWLLDLNLTMT